MARLVLVGLPGTGKSTLARRLGKSWGCAVVDTDDVLSASVGCSPGQYLRTSGVDAFRREELAALRCAVVLDAVVATGGGVVSTPEARALLRSQITVWLDCSDEVLAARVGDGDRPLLGDDPPHAIAALRLERESLYREVSIARVDTSGDLDEAMERVQEALAKVSR